MTNVIADALTTLLLAAALFIAYSAFVYVPPTQPSNEEAIPEATSHVDPDAGMIRYEVYFEVAPELTNEREANVSSLPAPASEVAQGWSSVEPINHTIRELKTFAKTYAIKKYSTMTKAGLYHALNLALN